MIVVVVALGVVAAVCWMAALRDLFRALRHPAEGIDAWDLFFNHWPRLLDINNFSESGHPHWRRSINRFVIGLLFAAVTGVLALLVMQPSS